MKYRLYIDDHDTLCIKRHHLVLFVLDTMYMYVT